MPAGTSCCLTYARYKCESVYLHSLETRATRARAFLPRLLNASRYVHFAIRDTHVGYDRGKASLGNEKISGDETRSVSRGNRGSTRGRRRRKCALLKCKATSEEQARTAGAKLFHELSPGLRIFVEEKPSNQMKAKRSLKYLISSQRREVSHPSTMCSK